MMLHVNCDFNLAGIFVINLIIFCTFFLFLFHLSSNCAVLCISVLLYLSLDLATCPVLPSLHVNKLN
jgi:hypothetical protein